MTHRNALGRVRVALVGLVLVAPLSCSDTEEQFADGDGRVIVVDHTEPDGRVVRAGLGNITYQTHFDGEKEGLGLLIEVSSDDGRRSTATFPLPEIDEEFQVLGAFGGGALGHVSVFAVPTARS